MLYKEAVHELLRAKRGDDFYMISRSGWTGLQSISGILQGDQEATWDGLHQALTGLLSNAFTGQSVIAHNLGGYEGEQSEVLYLRWVALGVFSPLFAIWTAGSSGGEPWNFGDKLVLEHYRALACWRMRLLPYLHSAMLDYRDELTPMIRPLPLELPDDPRACAVEDQFLCGSEILVAPILEERDSRSVYLPRGEWLDFWTDQQYAGGTDANVKCPLDRIPAFVRAGGIVPLEENAYFGEDLGDETLEVRVYGLPSGRQLRLVDQSRESQLSFREAGIQSFFEFEAVERPLLKLVWHGSERPVRVTFGDTELPGVSDGVGEADSGFSYDASLRRREVRVPARQGGTIAIETS